jgi:hypothetical protein
MAVNGMSWGLLACCYRKSPGQLQARLLAPSSDRRDHSSSYTMALALSSH